MPRSWPSRTAARISTLADSGRPSDVKHGSRDRPLRMSPTVAKRSQANEGRAASLPRSPIAQPSSAGGADLAQQVSPALLRTDRMDDSAGTLGRRGSTPRRWPAVPSSSEARTNSPSATLTEIRLISPARQRAPVPYNARSNSLADSSEIKLARSAALMKTPDEPGRPSPEMMLQPRPAQLAITVTDRSGTRWVIMHWPGCPVEGFDQYWRGGIRTRSSSFMLFWKRTVTA